MATLAFFFAPLRLCVKFRARVLSVVVLFDQELILHAAQIEVLFESPFPRRTRIHRRKRTFQGSSFF